MNLKQNYDFLQARKKKVPLNEVFNKNLNNGFLIKILAIKKCFIQFKG